VYKGHPFLVGIIPEKFGGFEMDNLKDWLLGLDTLILVVLIFGGFVIWELKSGEIPLRWFGSIRRDTRPVFYWISILFHLAILGIVVYSWMIGLRIPVSRWFEST
jgi:uncharacterized membrane-anchored protein